MELEEWVPSVVREGMGVAIVRVVAVVGQVVRHRVLDQLRRMVDSRVCMFLVVPVP